MIPTPKELEPQFTEADIPEVSDHILNWRKNRNFNAVFMLFIAGMIAVIFLNEWFIWLGVALLGAHKFTHHFPYTKQWLQRYQEVQTQLEQSKAEWRKHTGVEELLRIRASLEKVKAGLEQLPDEMKARVSEYMQNRRSLHLRDYLEQFQIQEAKIHGIGAAKNGVDLVRYRNCC